jgi:hypothetical protein
MRKQTEIPISRYIGGVQVGMVKPMAIKNPSPAVKGLRTAAAYIVVLLLSLSAAFVLVGTK